MRIVTKYVERVQRGIRDHNGVFPTKPGTTVPDNLEAKHALVKTVLTNTFATQQLLDSGHVPHVRSGGVFQRELVTVAQEPKDKVKTRLQYFISLQLAI